MRKNLPARALQDFPPRVRSVILAEAASAGVDTDLVLSGTRKKAVTRVRFRIWKRQREELTRANGERTSLALIGAMWGCDHTTVRYGIQRLQELEA